MKYELKRVVLATADVNGVSGHLFPRSELERIVTQAARRAGKIFGQYGMPMRERLETEDHYRARCIQVDLTQVSHALLNFRIEDSDLVCDVQPSGALAHFLGQELYCEVPVVRFAMRGFCSTIEHGVISNYQFVTADAVPIQKPAQSLADFIQNTVQA